MIDRQALVAQALRECDTLAEAERRVEAMLRLAGLAPAGPAARPAEAPSAALLLPPPASPQPVKRRKYPQNRYQWHRDPEMCARAAALLDNAGLPETARILACSQDALRHAVSRGYITPETWQPDPVNVARGYKAAITMEKDLRDYARAERALDGQDDEGRVNGG